MVEFGFGAMLINDDEINISIKREDLVAWLKGGKPTAGKNDEPQKDNAPKDEVGQDADDGPAPESSGAEGLDLFESVTKHGVTIGGELQNEKPNGRAKIDEIRAWLKENKFNYKNFCRYLASLDELSGHKLSRPLIGSTGKGDPTLFKVAARYYTYWKGQKFFIAEDYKKFVLRQLEDLGYTVAMVKKEFDGVEVDPTTLEPVWE